MRYLFFFLALQSCICFVAPAYSHSRVFIPSATHAPQPFPWLNGGSFSGPEIPFHPDPLATYQWLPDVNSSQLQIFCLLPLFVSLTPATNASYILNSQSLLTQTPNVTISGVGAIELDFGVNSAAWLEFDSPDLTTEDAQNLQLSISEYKLYEITNLGAKIGQAVAYHSNNSLTTYRLEIPHPDGSGLYEGIRFAWVNMTAPPSQSFHITALRLVCQIKPQNWAGKFAAVGDDKLSRLWYLGAYTVKVNLLADQFGSILIYRGDRFSWTGDAHVAQATAMVSLGNFGFVRDNLFFTKDNCNGIESYCLYFVLSVCDYFKATNDTQTARQLADAHVAPKLERAYSLLQQDVIKLGFFGWDDRLGSGFSNVSSAEAQRCFRYLAINTFQSWAIVLRDIGLSSDAQHFEKYAAAAIAEARSAPGFLASIGIHAAAEAINGGWLSTSEVQLLLHSLFNDLTTICSLSAFNTYFILRALAAAGDIDRGIYVIHACWNVMIDLGATTSWETSKPGWSSLLKSGDGVPAFQDGFTSLAHPWSSGPTQWLSEHVTGFAALADGQGGRTWRLRPYLGAEMRGVMGVQPLPDGSSISIVVRTLRMCAGDSSASGGKQEEEKEEVEEEESNAMIIVSVPRTVKAELHVSEVLAARLVQLADDTIAQQRHILVKSEILNDSGDCATVVNEMSEKLCSKSSSSSSWSERGGWEPLVFDTCCSGPLKNTDSSRMKIAAFGISAGGCARFKFKLAKTVDQPGIRPALPFPRNSFPPPFYPAYFLGVDQSTSGDWIGSYGGAGYYLVSFDGAGRHRSKLPDWVISVQQNFGPDFNDQWTSPPSFNDSRALLDPDDPSGARKIGFYSAAPPPAPGWAPSFPLDVEVDLSKVPPNSTLQFAFYFVDWDFGGRKQSVQLMDRHSLADVSHVQIIESFEGGVWMIWQYRGGIRMRVNYIRGTNQVVSAVLFDVIPSL